MKYDSSQVFQNGRQEDSRFTLEDAVEVGVVH